MLPYNIKLIITVICAILLLLILLTPHQQREGEGNNDNDSSKENVCYPNYRSLLFYPSIIFQYQIAVPMRPTDSF